jgi:hypothetical protein
VGNRKWTDQRDVLEVEMTDATGPPATAEGSSATQEKTREVAGEVKDRAQEAAGQAQEKAQEAAGQAQEMVREQVGRRSTEAGERVSATAEDIRSVGEELRKQGKDQPAKLAEQAAQRAESLGHYLQRSDGDTILGDLEDFGRRRPWAVVAGGLALGIAASRFLKASSSRRYQSRFESSDRLPARREDVAPPAGRVPQPGDLGMELGAPEFGGTGAGLPDRAPRVG